MYKTQLFKNISEH